MRFWARMFPGQRRDPATTAFHQQQEVLAMLQDLEHPSEEVRSMACRKLGAIAPGAPYAIEPLIRRLTDKCQQVRWDAATALGAFKSFSAGKLIATLIDDVDRRDLARVALELMGEAAVPALAQAMDSIPSWDSNSRNTVMEILENLEGASVNAMAGLLCNKDDFVRQRARQALLKQGRKSLESLERALPYASNERVIDMLAIIGELGDRGLPILFRFMLSRHNSVYWRASAAGFKAYRQSGISMPREAFPKAREFMPQVLRLLAFPDEPEVRIAAAYVMRESFTWLKARYREQARTALVFCSLSERDEDVQDALRSTLRSLDGENPSNAEGGMQV